jgi:uncharacterized protein YutE (UPF0331/DUF86 family)
VLEALLDLGRYVLAKGFATGVSEYKEIAEGLRKHKVLADELFEICSMQLGDVEHLANDFREWFANHRDRLDDTL